jgi:hypothetical protein
MCGMESGSADAIERYFRDYFRPWDITLPSRDIALRAAGHIFERGWHIYYVWGTDDGEEYLEVLAQHRMTNDRHFRVFASGRAEYLPAPAEFYSYGPEATEAKKDAAKREYFEHNRRVYSDLRERGLLPPLGRNLVSHELNEYLRAGSDCEQADSGRREASFICGECGAVAAYVVLLAPGETDPRLDPEPPGVPPGVGSIQRDETRLSISAAMGVTVSPVKAVTEVARALERADAAALSDIDPEYASFWCPRCEKSYCHEHWVLETVFDDGFYDLTDGTCPSGHRRKVDD